MKIPFFKYQGTGNDFVIIDQSKQQYLKKTDTTIIQRLCDRKFGVGADGLILLQLLDGYDFEMIYFNADGKEGSMCGNGGRCAVAFAQKIGLIEQEGRFLAIDGLHEAKINDDWVELKMSNVTEVEQGADYYILNTGSPHYIIFAEDIDDINIIDTGAAIRYSKPFREEGINVNFVEITKDGLIVATYERGVEAETLSCGTGVTAAAIAYALKEKSKTIQAVPIQTKGGKLEIKFKKSIHGFEDIWLCGKATLVFEGDICV